MIALYIAGAAPVIWLALVIAPSVRDGLSGIVSRIAGITLGETVRIELCRDSLRTVVMMLVLYAASLGMYLSSDSNYRRREEHGSAKWGSAQRMNKKYAAPEKTENKVLTRNVSIGLDGRKHRRNLNVLVCGGSGSGKTRCYAKPNLMNANTSMVVLDPKRAIFKDNNCGVFMR